MVPDPLRVHGQQLGKFIIAGATPVLAIASAIMRPIVRVLAVGRVCA